MDASQSRKPLWKYTPLNRESEVPVEDNDEDDEEDAEAPALVLAAGFRRVLGSTAMAPPPSRFEDAFRVVNLAETTEAASRRLVLRCWTTMDSSSAESESLS